MQGPIPPGTVALCDYERLAEASLAPDLRAYFLGVAADGLTERANREAWSALRLRGRVLGDLRGASTATQLFGLDLEHPVLLAPVAFQGLLHGEAEHGSALGAAATGSLAVLSAQSGVLLEDVAARAQGPLWFQLYLQPRREDSADLIARAEAAGYKALVVTVDAPVTGLRNDEVRAGFTLPEGYGALNLARYAAVKVPPQPGRSPAFLGMLERAPRWTDIAWLRGQTRLPILIKGIMDAEDAVLALEHGADGVIVSNHGGRGLDTLPSTAEVLPEVVAALAGRIPVLADGGIRRGTDVLKALALGARAVLVGRPQAQALHVAGAAGVAHMLSLLRAELEVAMALTGVARIDQISRAQLR